MADDGYLGQYLHALPPSTRNITSAAMALARISELGWAPRGGYPGPDVLWPVKCLLCGWDGLRFYSHRRHARPKDRHAECVPVGEIADRLDQLGRTAAGSCRCTQPHAVNAEAFHEAAVLLGSAHADGAHKQALFLAERLLGPCTAAVRRGRGAQRAFPRS
ncbi:hypothetical protein [Streptomyces erythrochromogenes]|uniref:hypothetical protein n=1 Tax=Streptomyces erythrochromogenes TaxID=285574 RepID=UPI00367CC73E